MDFVGLGCDRICEVSYKLIGHLIYIVCGQFILTCFILLLKDKHQQSRTRLLRMEL
jgi:hypothetical protein